MILRHKELINLPVETKEGQALGFICDFEYEAETNKISRFHVKKGRLVASFINKNLIIHADQVVAITKEKMIVEDTAIKQEKAVREAASI